MEQKSPTVEELVENDSFRRMVNGNATEEEIEHWNNWIEAGPHNRRIARKAAAGIAEFEFEHPGSPDIEAEWDKLDKRTGDNKGENRIHKLTRKLDLSGCVFRIGGILLFCLDSDATSLDNTLLWKFTCCYC